MANRRSQIIVQIKGAARAALEARAVAAGFEAVDGAIEDVRASALAAAIGLDVLSRAQRRVARAQALMAATSIPAVSGLGMMAAVALPLGSVILPALAVALWQVGAAAAVWGAALVGATLGVAAAVGLMVAASIARFGRMRDVVGSAAYHLSNQLWLLRETFLEVTAAGADRVMRGLAAGVGALLPLVRGLRDEMTAIGEAIGDVARQLGERIGGMGPQISAMLAQVPAVVDALGAFAGDALELLVRLATVGAPLLADALRGIGSWFRDLAASLTPERIEAATATLRDFAAGVAGWWREFTAPIREVLTPAIDEAGGALSGWAHPLGVLVAALIQIGRILLPPISMLLDTVARQLVGLDVGGLDVSGIASALVDAMQAAIGFGQGLIGALAPAAPLIGNVLLPLLDGLLAGIGGPVLDILGLIAGALGALGAAAAPLRPVFRGVGEVASIVFGGALLRLAGMVARTIPLIGRLAGPVLTRLGEAWDWVGARIWALIRWAVPRLWAMMGTVSRVVTGIIGVLGSLVTFVTGLPDQIARAATGLWDGLTTGLRAVIGWIRARLDWIVDKVEWVKDKIDGVFGGVVGVVGGIGEKIGGAVGDLVPGAATGGVIQRGGWAIVGERGPELVELPTGATVYSHDELRGLIDSERLLPRPREVEAPRGPLIPRVLEAQLHVVTQLDGRVAHRSVERVRANLDARA